MSPRAQKSRQHSPLTRWLHNLTGSVLGDSSIHRVPLLKCCRVERGVLIFRITATKPHHDLTGVMIDLMDQSDLRNSFLRIGSVNAHIVNPQEPLIIRMTEVKHRVSQIGWNTASGPIQQHLSVVRRIAPEVLVRQCVKLWSGPKRYRHQHTFNPSSVELGRPDPRQANPLTNWVQWCKH
jgi:hypothetical protein